MRTAYERAHYEPSFFGEYRVEVAKDFCIAYGLTWALLKADPFSAGVFICLFRVISDYAKGYFQQYFSPEVSDALSLVSGFVGAKVIGSFFRCHLTIREALSILLIVSLATHLIIYSFPLEKKAP